jgi:hypothetical protein
MTLVSHLLLTFTKFVAFCRNQTILTINVQLRLRNNSRLGGLMKLTALILATLLLASMAIAGTIDPRLAEKIATSDPNTLQPTLIFMQNQLDVTAMKHKHDLMQATFAQRHFEVITALRDMATESQADLLAYLAREKSLGTVGEYRGYWITNMVYAELSPSEIQAVAAKSAVNVVYADFKAQNEKPVPVNSDIPPIIASVERGLKAIKADSMWALGFTGRGRLVCNIDTGVDGNHPALSARWRGANGHPASQSWLDTSNPSSTFPIDENDHGTHTMGTLCGRSYVTPDTIGVAIDIAPPMMQPPREFALGQSALNVSKR